MISRVHGGPSLPHVGPLRVQDIGKAGYGLGDMELTPKNMKRGLPGTIIETGRSQSTSELEKAAEDAFAQTENAL